MKIVVSDDFIEVLEWASIFQKRTGMGRVPESKVTRFRLGDVITCDEHTAIEEF